MGTVAVVSQLPLGDSLKKNRDFGAKQSLALKSLDYVAFTAGNRMAEGRFPLCGTVSVRFP